MKKHVKATVCMIATALSISTVVQAEPIMVASLTQIKGKVLVNKGKGYVMAAKSGMPLADGDRLMTLDESSAVVAYPDGCVTNIDANSLLAVDKSVACGKETVSNTLKQPLRYAAAIGETATDAGGTAEATGGTLSLGGLQIPTALAVVGGIGLAAGTGVIIASNNDGGGNNNDKPISAE